MAVSLAAKLSGASGNQATFGSDGGIFTPQSTALTNSTGLTIDNYFAASGAQWWYQMHTYQFNQLTQAANTAQVWPLIVAKSCRVTDAQIYVSTAGAGSTLYMALFNATGPNKQAGTKITELMRFSTTAVGIARAASIDTATVLSGQTLYWAVTWTYTTSSYPAIYCRTLNSGYHRSTAISATNFGQSGMVSTDGGVGWSSLTAAPSPLPALVAPGSAPTSANIYPPLIQWGLTNT